MKITIFTTGGTIDKDYATGAGTYNFEVSEPAAKRILDIANPGFQYDIRVLLKKDSLDMTDADRQRIYDACKNAADDKIIITHGTDTMIETARKLSGIKNKAIVLVGSSKPAKFSDSDAHFNLGTATGGISVLASGIYIAMNGEISAWNRVMKNPKTGKFERIR
jgi:L-asparaginase